MISANVPFLGGAFGAPVAVEVVGDGLAGATFALDDEALSFNRLAESYGSFLADVLYDDAALPFWRAGVLAVPV